MTIEPHRLGPEAGSDDPGQGFQLKAKKYVIMLLLIEHINFVNCSGYHIFWREPLWRAKRPHLAGVAFFFRQPGQSMLIGSCAGKEGFQVQFVLQGKFPKLCKKPLLARQP